MKILIQPTIYQIMLAHTQHLFPQEACGLLAGQENYISHFYSIENILHSPVAFEMDAQQQIEAMLNAEERGFDLLATYHSHPHGPQTPSPTDIAKAYYPELAQIIISLHVRANPTVRGFTIIDEHVTELQLLLQ
jgi:proteasome lid subunit RPN8/RPN11